MQQLKIITIFVVSISGCQCGPMPSVLPDGGLVFAGGNAGSGNSGGSSAGGMAGGSAAGGSAGGAAGGSVAGGGVVAGGGDTTCAAVSSQANITKKPVDIIMVIDNSCSMSAEIDGVQSNINTNFANVVGAGGLDYRVILISKHGTSTPGQSICITAPLSGNATCNPVPAMATNAARFFQYDTEIGSNDELTVLLRTYDTAAPAGRAPTTGWREWLRADAYKVFVVITDDNSNLSATNFETQLFAKMPQNFGTANNRQYTFHSIIGVAAKAMPATPYLSTEPTVSGQCNTAVNNGSVYQPLSINSGGLRFPLCDPSLYNTVFTTIANGVVASAKVSCSFTLPPPPAGIPMFSKIIAQYTPGGTGAVQEFTKVSNASMCTATSYTVTGNQLTLCPQACAVVENDTMAKVDLKFTCEPELM